jgi:drug/metabolite transporter (DMT)-like permease
LNKVLFAHLSVLGATIIYGANYVIMKKVTPGLVDPFGLVVHRAGIACILFFITGFFIREKMQKSDLLKCAMLALFGVACNQMLFIKGLSLTSPINASIMMLMSPLLVVFLALLFGKERATYLKLGGIFLGLFGAGMVVMYGAKGHVGFQGNWKGDIMIFFNALSWGIYLIFAKPLMAKYNTITVVKWVFLFGSLYALPFGYSQAVAVDFSAFDSASWFNYVYVIVATTYLAYILNTYALKALSSSIVSAYIYLQPILAAVFGVLYGMDTLSVVTGIGALIVFAGVFMVSYTGKK